MIDASLKRRARQVSGWIWFICLTASFQACDCTDTIDKDGSFIEPKQYGTYIPDRRPVLDAPNVVDFGLVEMGQQRNKVIEVSNVGRAPLKITSWQISDDFKMLFEGRDEPITVIDSKQTISIELIYTATRDSAVEGVLTINSNDPTSPKFDIALDVNVERPCLAIDPSPTLNFGIMAPGETKSLFLNVTNCSETVETTFSVASLPFRADDTGFVIVNSERFREPVTLQPIHRPVTVEVEFTPPKAGTFEDVLTVKSNDPRAPVQEIKLVGRGQSPECPKPVIVASHEDRGTFTANPSGTYKGLPLDFVNLDASKSEGAKGARIERVQWSIIQRPTDSAARLNNEEVDVENGLFLDLSGQYTLELDVWDTTGTKSCAPARMKFLAVPDEDFHIQLVWDTPNDAEQLDDEGADLDLHLLNPRGVWNEQPYDCHWQNDEPSWGNPNDTRDDPSLDIDDLDGWGPENINLNNPEVDTNYSVGVHYFTDLGFGASFATVRFYLKGTLVSEFVKRRMLDQQFWHVFDVTWPNGQVNVIDKMYSNFPNLL